MAALRRFDLEVDLVGGGLDLRFGVAAALGLGIVRNAPGLGASGIHARAPCGFRRIGSRTCLLRGLEIGGDALLARFDRRLDLRHHPPRDHEEDEAERDRQPQELRQIDLGSCES